MKWLLQRDKRNEGRENKAGWNRERENERKN
jgi:hypothetical protein